MMMKNEFHVIYDRGISDAFESLDQAQVSLTESGVPHHALHIMQICYKYSGGMKEKIESTHLHAIWWKHWRNLELAKRAVSDGV